MPVPPVDINESAELLSETELLLDVLAESSLTGVPSSFQTRVLRLFEALSLEDAPALSDVVADPLLSIAIDPKEVPEMSALADSKPRTKAELLMSSPPSVPLRVRAAAPPVVSPMLLKELELSEVFELALV